MDSANANMEEEACCGMFAGLCQTSCIPMVGNYLHGTGLHLVKQLTVLSQTSLPCFIHTSCDLELV